MTTSTEREGVIKYRCQHRQQAPTPTIDLTELNRWRSQMLQLNMIGQTGERYGGLGFGNISQRAYQPNDQHTTQRTDQLQPGFAEDAFVISGSQTGHLKTLQAADIAIVEQADPEQNCLNSQGFIQPSSEALTHAVIYQQQADCNAVIHVHCPIIWQRAQSLNLPCTDEAIPYGTPMMASAIAELLQSASGVIVMLGHQDGVIGYAPTLQGAAEMLVDCQKLAQQSSNRK